VGRFKKCHIYNMDQTPLPFEFGGGRTYATKGSRTVWVKEMRSGWDKRQATGQFCVCACGHPHVDPLVMFRGKPGVGDARRKAEFKKYAKGVHVIFNDKAYANGENLKQWARQQFKWGSPFSPADNEPRLLSMDVFAAHKKSTDEIKAQDDFVSELHNMNTTTSLIPPGGTGYVQVLDISINKLIKTKITEYEEAHYDLYEDKWKAGKFSVQDRRILLVEWVAKAWKDLHDNHQDVIRKTFEQVGLSLNPDGSEDWKLKIRDLLGLTLLP